MEQTFLEKLKRVKPGDLLHINQVYPGISHCDGLQTFSQGSLASL